MNDTVMKKESHLENLRFLNVLLGAWLLVSPFVLGFAHLEAAKWNDVAVGIAVALLALSYGAGRAIGGLLDAVLGVWLIISSFVLVASGSIAFWNSLIVGILIVAIAMLAGATTPLEDRTTIESH